MALPRHATSAVHTMLVVALAVAVANLDGYHNHWGGSIHEGPPTINWAHGWPAPCLVRMSIFPLANGPGGPIVPVMTGQLGYYSRWPIDQAPIAAFYPWLLFADLLISLAIIGGTGYFLFKARVDRLQIRFSLRTMLILFALFAAYFQAQRFPQFERYARLAGQVAVASILVGGVVLTLASVVMIVSALRGHPRR